MAASPNDKARKSYSYLQKTLNTGINASDTVLTPNNVTSIPTDTGVSFVVDRVDSSGTKTPTLRELMTGYVSGGTLAGLVRGEQGTTAQAHLAGAVIEFVNSGEMWNDLIDFLLQDHSNPNGNHKTLTDDNGNEWLERGQTASAVNQVKITNAATGNKPAIAANGDDTNIGLTIQSKGSGNVEISPGNSSGLVKVDGSAPKQFAQNGHGNFFESGCIWTADAAGSTRLASMSSGVVWIAGKRLTVAAIANRTFTASKDTYVDFTDNGDGTAVPTYAESSNNAASQALTANGVRNAVIVTGAGNIAASTSIGQGGFANILPVVSTQTLKGFDTLGNLIYPKGPVGNQLTADPYKFLVYRQAAWTDGNGALANVTFDQKMYDTGNNYSTSTGLFTAPVAGFYLFTWSIAKSQTSNTAMLSTLKQIALSGGGATYYSGNQCFQGATTGGAATTGSALVQMAAGDTAQIQSYGSGGAGTTGMGQFGGTYFSGALVSAS